MEENKKNTPKCVICNKPVRDSSTDAKGNPTHKKCIGKKSGEFWKNWLKDEKTKKKTNVWDFSEFKIMCRCGSTNVEINGEIEIEYGYYDCVEEVGDILMKCHDCGNAINVHMGGGFAEIKGMNEVIDK